jgi:agmatine/peptidylarginine deiminase
MSAVFTALFLCATFGTPGALHDLSHENPLPRWMTSEESERIDEIGTYTAPTSPPSGPVRCPAEFEKRSGVLFGWSFGSWEQVYLDMVEALQDQVKCYIVTTSESSVRQSILNHGLPLTNVEFINESLNSVWMRDYGPWFIFHEDCSPGITDFTYNRPRPLDDVFPQNLAADWSLPCYTTNLVHAGGNFAVAGMGVCFASDLVDDENYYNYSQIADIFDEYTGCATFHMLDRLNVEYTGHIDMYFKPLDPGTILIGEYDDPGNNDYYTIEANAEEVGSLNSSYQRPYRIRRIPQPDVYGWYDVVRSYTNSLIVNDKILLPVYNTSLDDIAAQIYEDLLPGYTIHPIDCSNIIESGGAIHCITMGVADPELVYIGHIPYRDLPPHPEEGYQIAAQVSPSWGNELSEVSMYWNTTGTEPFEKIVMTKQGDYWTASIPQHEEGTEIFYYVEARDLAGHDNTHPFGAPARNHTFICGQNIAVALEPEDTFLHPGETLEYRIRIQNLSDSNQTIRGWGNLYLQNKNPYPKNPVIGPKKITLKGGASIQRTVTHPLPGNTPSQLYYYEITVVDQNENPQDTQWFHFLVQ